MERGYFFDSINLGMAFAKELEELGYEYRDRGSWGWYSDLVSGGNLKPESLHLDPNEKLSVHNHQEFLDIKTFDLEKEWVEALSDAKKKAKNKKELPNLKFFNCDVKIIDPLTLKIGSKVREKFYLRKVLKDLKNFPEHKVQNIIDQLEKILN